MTSVKNNIRVLIIGLTLIFSLGISNAQVPVAGVITGKITDGETGEALRGASVMIVETKNGAYSDTKGMYRIKKVADGIYSLRITYVGYEPRILEKVVVVDGKPTTTNVVMSVITTGTKEVVVEAERSNDNAAAMLAARKNASQVSDGIGREEISKLSDGDAGQALKRVSGVTLVEGKYVFVRGTSDRYSNTTLNGSALTSTEPDKKSFAFDMFPSELLENANVIKSFTPDLPGNFAGGLVQLNTIDFPVGTSLKLSASQGFNDYVTFKGGGFMNTAGGGTDWIGIDDGSRALPSDFPIDRLAMNQLLRDVKNSSDPALQAAAVAKLDNIGRQFQNDNWSTGTETVAPNGSIALTYTDIFSVGEVDQLGLVASANYGSGWQNNRMVRGGVLSDPNDYLFKFNGFSSTHTVSWSALMNVAYRIGSTSTISFKNAFNRSADVENVYLSGENFAQSVEQRLLSFQFVQKQLYAGTFGGEHTLSMANNALLDWKLGFSNSKRDEPDFRRLQFLRNSSDSGQPLFAGFDQSPQGAGSRAGRFFSNLNDDAISAGFNFTMPITTTFKVKVGGLVENRSRTFKARSLTIVQGSENNVSDLFTIPDNDVIPDLRSMFADSLYSVEKGRLSYSEDSKLADQYDALENLVAGYAMIDAPFEIAGLQMRTIVGARLEKSVQELNSFTVTDEPVRVDQNLLDVLPAVNLIIKPNESFNIRLGASQTLARPSLREYAPFQFYDFQQQATIAGNPNLKRALIKNYDLRFEYFTGPGEVLSLSGFYKQFHNAIEETIFPQQSEIVRSFGNANGQANNIGIELEIRKSLGFIAEPLQFLIVSFNGAIINSDITVEQAGVKDSRAMWGQSPYTINASLAYVNPDTRTSVTFGYNTAGRRIIQVNLVGVFQGDPHVYELPRDVIDFSVIQPIGEAFEVKLAIRDLLNQPLKWEQSGALIQSNVRGMGVTLGFGYKLQ